MHIGVMLCSFVYYCEMFSVCVCVCVCVCVWACMWIFLLLFFSLPEMVNKVEYIKVCSHRMSCVAVPV